MRIDRDQFPADLIQREVLSKQRRALVVYGEGHFMRKPPWGSNLVTRLGAELHGQYLLAAIGSAFAVLKKRRHHQKQGPEQKIAKHGSNLANLPDSCYPCGT